MRIQNEYSAANTSELNEIGPEINYLKEIDDQRKKSFETFRTLLENNRKVKKK
ncbi:MAG: hypothetical protein LBI29_01065 [Rickettsiales bacterium]|nr:hypothetical protein [Rickettsiales bacterium]